MSGGTYEEEYEEEYQRNRARLAALLAEHDDFLPLLVEAARTFGHSGDLVEIDVFVRWVFGVTGADCPDDLSPYQQP